MGWIGLIANIVGFKVVWLSSVMGAAAGYWWLGPLALLLFAIFQLAFKSLPREWLLIASVGALGFFVDSAYLGRRLDRIRVPQTPELGCSALDRIDVDEFRLNP